MISEPSENTSTDTDRRKYYTLATREGMPIHRGEGAETLIGAMVNVTREDEVTTAARSFVGYAPPLVWGPGVTVASHIGSVTYTIEYSAVGDTVVMGRVTYWKGSGGGRKVTEEFRDSTTITTSNSVATVDCEFKGLPTGSTVNGTCNP